MAKFKVGDKVRVTKCLHGHGFNINEIVEITHHNVVNQDYECYNGLDGWLLRETEFELYEEKETEMFLINEMTAEQIRNEILRINSRIEEANKDIEKAQEERNSLVEKLRERGFELRSIIPVKSEPVEIPVDYSSLEIGKEYKVKSGNETSYFSDGEVVTIARIDVPNATHTVMVQDDCGDDDWMHHSDLCEI